MSNARQQVLLQTQATRQNAEKLLDSLLRAQAECDQQLQKEQRSDAMKSITGSSSLDKAITTTRRMIEQLDRSLEQMTKDLDQGESETPSPAPPPVPEPPAAAGTSNVCDIRVVVGNARVVFR